MYEFLDYETHDVMTRSPVSVGPDVPIGEAQAILDKGDFNGVPVVDEAGMLLGMVTKLDLLRAFDFDDEHMLPPYHEVVSRPVRSVMSRDVYTVCPRTRLTRVLRKMVDRRCKSFPVVEDGRLVGIVAREDVLRGLHRAVAGERPAGTWEGEES